MFPRYSLDPSSFGTRREPFLSLLYRYWFWDWLFADASQRDLLRRAAARRHNVAQRIHLPCYMRRWTACSLMWLGLGCALEHGFSHPWSIASAYTGAVLALLVLIVAATGWLLLRTDDR
jgi:hypothetical protein